MNSNDTGRNVRFSVILGTAVALGIALVPATGSAKGKHDDGCRTVKGAWSSDAVPVPPCTSAVGICTNGQLKGSLNGASYDFTMNTLNPEPEPEAPFVAIFTGISSITTRHGHVFRGVDTGAMNVSPPGFFGSGKFSTLLSVVAGGTGFLQIRGTLNFVTGAASGDYQGEICSE
jgi:hypothetical protein